jgi:tetraprenyl-beta-curcumene synthase
MLVTFQAAYDFADTIAEQPADNPIANGRQLHRSLLDALNPIGEHPDYYEHSRLRDDGGYLNALADSCRISFQEMPSHALVHDGATCAASKIATYQSLNHGGSEARDKLARWAKQETPQDADLRWWETSAACASSLTALALLSAAANPNLSSRDVRAIEDAYHPWIGALHTLLDSLVDWNEDEHRGQPSLLDHYGSGSELEQRLQIFARRSRQAVRTLPNAARHETVLVAMASVYLTTPYASSTRVTGVSERVLDEIGDLVRPTLLVLRARRRTLRQSA